MNRWENRWPVMEQEGESGSSGDLGIEPGDGLEAPTPPTDPPSSPTPTDINDGTVSSPFDNPEVMAKIALLETTVREQGSILTAAHNTAPAPAAPVAAPPEEVSSEEYWANPAKYQREMIEDVVGKQLKTIIEPFQAEQAFQQAERAWNTVRNQYPGVDAYRTLIETRLQGYGVGNPTADTIKTLYLEAVGEASLQGTPPVTSQAQAQALAPPQHAPSSHPVTPVAPTPTIRDLTEGEARMARESGMTHEEYLRMQSDPDGVDFMNEEAGS